MAVPIYESAFQPMTLYGTHLAVEINVFDLPVEIACRRPADCAECLDAGSQPTLVGSASTGAGVVGPLRLDVADRYLGL